MMIKVSFTLILLFSLFILSGQTASLEDGIYLNIDEFKRNQPSILLENILSTPEMVERFLDAETEVVPKRLIAVVNNDTLDIIQRNIWAYVKDGTLYIKHNSNLGDSYHRALLAGSIIYYAEERASGNGSSIGPNGEILPNRGTSTRYVHFLIDTKTGDQYKYNVENFELLIKDDTVLLYEFNTLSKKKKKDSLFLYIQKYNKKNPVQN